MLFNEYLQKLYDYHYWANARVLDSAARMEQARLETAGGIPLLYAPLGQSWGTIFGILVHIWTADWIWLQRWHGFSPASLPDETQFSGLADLRREWKELEGEMHRFVAGQDETSLAQIVTYTNTAGAPGQMALWQMLVHVPNHAAHHRGELAAAFALLGVEHEEEDMNLYWLGR